jgi:hypothetical protein
VGECIAQEDLPLENGGRTPAGPGKRFPTMSHRSLPLVRRLPPAPQPRPLASPALFSAALAQCTSWALALGFSVMETLQAQRAGLVLIVGAHVRA